MNQHDEPHNQFISALSGKLDVLSDILIVSIAPIVYNLFIMRPIPKSQIITMIILCITKMIMAIFRVSVTNGYMGFGYTWSLYWQTLEAYTLIILESYVVIRYIFASYEK
ncbi:hypothetical protein K505DRAFT_355652 [Melanomma pulvis-pyrius CBS 109.77]|uniref:Uncharacterized protein n=1 Tax=Melanomma pulvis-pyrius CBS 109.77 TaxID=1314802 RepID=A0A6A6XVB1_9PLEO|nr:hypothetical protein K505DRAFT_355652 [Melanomma pulvis-pyrius CBS 109.77]